MNSVLHHIEGLLAWAFGQFFTNRRINLTQSPTRRLISPTLVVDVGGTKPRRHRDIAISELFEADHAGSRMAWDELANDLDFIVVPNVKIGLHALENLVHIRRLHFEHDLEWEPFQLCKLLAIVIRVLEDGDPYLHRVVRILTLVEREAIVHGLLHEADVLVVANLKPVFHFLVDPALSPQDLKTGL